MNATPATGSRPHDPLRPEDVVAATGHPVVDVIRENESGDTPPDVALADGSWALTFTLAGGRYVSCYANRFPADGFTVQDDLAAWTAEQGFEPVDGVGDQAVVLADGTVWVRIGQEWTLQVQSSDDLPRSTRLALADAAARRLAGSEQA